MRWLKTLKKARTIMSLMMRSTVLTKTMKSRKRMPFG